MRAGFLSIALLLLPISSPLTTAGTPQRPQSVVRKKTHDNYATRSIRQSFPTLIFFSTQSKDTTVMYYLRVISRKLAKTIMYLFIIQGETMEEIIRKRMIIMPHAAYVIPFPL